MSEEQDKLEMKYFDFQLTRPTSEPRTMSMFASELKALRPVERRARIDSMLENGEIELKVWPAGKKKPTGFDVFVCNGEPFPYQKCVACGFYVAGVNGGHKTVHVRRKCMRKKGGARSSTSPGGHQNPLPFDEFVDEDYDDPTKPSPSTLADQLHFTQYPTIDKNQEVLELVSKYCLSSGTSLEHAEADSFRELVLELLKAGGMSIYAASHIHLPSASEIRLYCEAFKFSHIRRSVHEEISRQVQTRSATIYLDFGAHINNFACAFIIFIKLENSENSTEIRPLGFLSTDNLKSGDDIKKWIIDSASYFGIPENEVLALNLVTDGIRSDGIKIEGFQNCDNSGTSKIENLTEWVLNPTSDMKEKLTEMEIAELQKCEEQIDHFCEIGRFVKRTTSLSSFHNSIGNLKLFPKLKEKIRFAREVFVIFEEIMNEETMIPLLTDKYADIDSQTMTELDHIFTKFEPMGQIFERNEVSIHHYLPKITAMNEFFKSKISTEHMEFTKSTIFKSAQLVTEHFLANEASNLHFKTTMLSPGHRRMSKLTPAAKLKATQLIEKELESVKLADSLETVKGETDVNLFDDDYDAPIEKEEDDELSTYLEDTALNRDEPLEFWSRRQTEFPKLSQIAFRCFSLISSRSLIERTFEKVRRVVENGSDPEIVEKLIIASFAKKYGQF